MKKVNIIPTKLRSTVTKKQWYDWRWQLAHSITNYEQLTKVVSLSAAESKKYQAVFARALKPGSDTMRVTPYLVSLINWKNPNDPIRLEHLPSAKEFKKDTYDIKNVWEKPVDFIDGTNRFIQQKYPDIVLLRLSNTCHSFCRFCFEKERTLRRQVKTAVGKKEFGKAVEYIKNNHVIRQVLISGGDPLVLADEILLPYIQQIALLPHISTIRINTRSFLHNPFRITEALASALDKIQVASWLNPARECGVKIEIGAHFNHPNELAPEVLSAIRVLARHNLAVYNQTVLLKGINDSYQTIATLFRKLRTENVRLHYLSHAMPVPGTAHLRTTVAAGMKIMKALKRSKEFRAQLPHFELSHHTGKQIIPDDFNNHFKPGKHGKKGLSVNFKSDITGRWEVQP